MSIFSRKLPLRKPSSHKMDLLQQVVILTLIIVVSQCCLLQVECVSVDQDLALTRNEKLALDKFRTEIGHFLPEPYMKEDIYLIRWLRAKNFNLPEAKEMLFENLKWRKANNMSTIQQEDWSDIEQDYVYHADTFDKQGRPIGSIRMGEWDFRRAVLSSRGPRLSRYLYKILDDVTGRVRTLQHQGKQVTQWLSLVDLEGYNLPMHGCIQCFGIYINYVTSYEAYFPGSVHEIIMVNTPAIFEAVLRVTRPLMAENTRNVLKVFGTNRNQWQSYLRQHIDASQLELHFGGNKIRSYE